MSKENARILAEEILKLNDKTIATNAIWDYGNKRHAIGITNGWEQCRKLIGGQVKKRREFLKNTVLEYDQENMCVPTIELIQFVTSLEDEMIRMGAESNEETVNAIAVIIDFMYEKLDKEIRFDRRLLFSRNWEADNKS